MGEAIRGVIGSEVNQTCFKECFQNVENFQAVLLRGINTCSNAFWQEPQEQNSPLSVANFEAMFCYLNS